MTLPVNHRSPAVEQMAVQWAIVDALMGGTPAMRRAGKKFLPKWPNEAEESYKFRLETATLFPAFRRTVSVMAGKPFSKELILSEDTPAQIREWAEDIDKEGVNLHSFASEMFVEAMSAGFGGILVEAPKRVATATNRPPTLAEQKAAGVRPYWVRVKHDQILGWRTTRVGGAARLSQLRILEVDTVDDGEWSEKEVARVRVLEPGRFRLYEQRADKTAAWDLIDEGTTGLNVIPFVPIYGLRRGFMAGDPPLIDLAYQNIEHWQAKSDQQTILHVARVPILFAKCFGDNEKIIVGASHALTSSSKEADVKYVEHSGQAIEAGRLSLRDLEEQMIQTGAELLVKRPGQRTATESSNDAEANKCELQRIVENFEDALDLALDYTAKFASLATGGKVTLFKDFGASTLTEASGQLINDMQARGLISKRTAIREQQRRGILSADIDPEKELAEVDNEGPPPGTWTDDE